MAKAHETNAFRNAAEFTVAITFKVAGGARRQTAERRARKVAERLTVAATRMAGVVEVSARGGISFESDVHWPSPISFVAANTGSDAHAEHDRLTRYLDPAHELALRSLAAVNAASRERRHADDQRRRAVGCPNAGRTPYSLDLNRCGCVYCAPSDPVDDAILDDPPGPNPFRAYRCLCGVAVPMPGQRCLAHRGVELVVLDGDHDALGLLDAEGNLER